MFKPIRNRTGRIGDPVRAMDGAWFLAAACALAVAAIIGLASCDWGATQVAGGGSDIGNGGTVTGLALDGNGHAAAGALVRLRPSEFGTESGASGVGKRAAGSGEAGLSGPAGSDGGADAAGGLLRSLDAHADAQGKFSLPGLDTGAYRIEILFDSAAQGALLDCRIPDSGAAISLGQAALRPTGSLTLRVPAGDSGDTATRFIRLIGVEHSASLRPGESKTLSGLPAGGYRAQSTAFSGNLRGTVTDTLQVPSAGTATLELSSPGCRDRQCDSASVLAFLRANALDTNLALYANSSGRITDLRFSTPDHAARFASVTGLSRLASLRTFKVEGPYVPDALMEPLLQSLSGLDSLFLLSLSWSKDSAFTGVPASLGRLSHIQQLYLMGDSLTALPDAIADLRDLQLLFISQNRLDALPDRIAALPNLTQVYAVDNHLSGLPESFYSLPATVQLQIFGNRLCSLTDAQKAWLASRNAYGGPQEQHCP